MTNPCPTSSVFAISGTKPMASLGSTTVQQEPSPGGTCFRTATVGLPLSVAMSTRRPGSGGWKGCAALPLRWVSQTVKIETACGAEGSAYGCQAVIELLESDQPPTAIVGLNDDTANGAYLAAYAKGLRVGVDLSVVGFDNIPQAASLVPGMTTVELFPRRLGKECATMLAGLLDQPETKLTPLHVAPVLIERGSVGPAK